MSVRLLIGRKEFRLDAKYDPSLTEFIRKLQFARWDKSNKQWILPRSRLECLKTFLYINKYKWEEKYLKWINYFKN